VSASNKAKPGNPNITTSPTATSAPATKTPSFAGPSSYGNTTTTIKAPAEKPASGTTRTPDATQPAAQDATTVEPSTSTKEPESKQPGLLQKIGKGVGDLVTGFKQGYSGNYDLSGDDAEPTARSQTKSTSAATQNTAEPTAANAGNQTTTTANVPATKVTFSSIKSKVDKLDKKGKQRILAALKKNLGIANTGSPAATTTSTVEKPATTTAQPAGANDLEKTARAAAAKPGFQRSAEDKIAIRTARAQGIDIPESKRFKKSLKESKNYSLPFSLFKK